MRNKTYTGIDVYVDKKSGEIITNTIPALISTKLFLDANEVRIDKLRRKGQFSRLYKDYLFRDFLICGSCKTPMGGRIKEKTNEKFYYCPLSERKFNSEALSSKECSMKRSLDITLADDELWGLILNILTDTKSIKNQFSEKSLLGDGLSTKQLKHYNNNQNLVLEEANTRKKCIEKALVKIESERIMGVYTSDEVYKGIKHQLNKEYDELNVQIDSINFQLEQIQNKQQWLDWIDEFGKILEQVEFNDIHQKKILLNHVLKEIHVDYNNSAKLHELQINFKLPVLLGFNNIFPPKSNENLNSVQNINILNPSESIIIPAHQRLPVSDYSTVTDFAKFLG